MLLATTVSSFYIMMTIHQFFLCSLPQTRDLDNYNSKILFRNYYKEASQQFTK